MWDFFSSFLSSVIALSSFLDDSALAAVSVLCAVLDFSVLDAFSLLTGFSTLADFSALAGFSTLAGFSVLAGFSTLAGFSVLTGLSVCALAFENAFLTICASSSDILLIWFLTSIPLSLSIFIISLLSISICLASSCTLIFDIYLLPPLIVIDIKLFFYRLCESTVSNSKGSSLLLTHRMS